MASSPQFLVGVAVRYLLDEHVPFAVTEGLRRRGIDAVSIQECGRAGLPDSAQLEFAHLNSYTVVTMDRDFLVLASRGVPHSGIVYIADSQMPIGHTIRSLAKLAAAAAETGLAGYVEFLQ